MSHSAVPAVFMRGGTSKGLFFHARDLPSPGYERDRMILSAMGSPDPYGRQLDGMGGGISSLSKVIIVGPSTSSDAILDYTFGQVAVDKKIIDWESNCGNLSSGVGCFAIDEGLITVSDGSVELCLHNTNTNTIVNSRFTVVDSRAAVKGAYDIQGVAGSGSPIELEFRNPGGAITGDLLPTGNTVDVFNVPGFGKIRASLVDATTACMFIDARDLGLIGNELPKELEGQENLLNSFETIRLFGAEAIRLPGNSLSVPKLAIIAPPLHSHTLSGSSLNEHDMDITARIISMKRPHQVLPLTGAMCLAVAAEIKGTIVNDVANLQRVNTGSIAIGHPSGSLSLSASVSGKTSNNDWEAENIVVIRTARRLMEGKVFVPDS